MLSWFATHSGDVVVLMILALIVGTVVFSMVRDKKKGKQCGCACSGCAMAGACHQQCGKKSR